MPYRIVRNDITKMHTEAIVNTANRHPIVGSGCDTAIYKAAGYEKLLEYRKEHIGEVKEGDAFLTPGFDLPAKYIIHAVSPANVGLASRVEKKLRDCYRNSLRIAKENGIKSISFPLISTGSFGYPKEEGLRIAIDEITAFLLSNHMEITLVVFDHEATNLGERLSPGLKKYIDQSYVDEKKREEKAPVRFDRVFSSTISFDTEMNETCPEPPSRGDSETAQPCPEPPSRGDSETAQPCPEPPSASHQLPPVLKGTAPSASRRFGGSIGSKPKPIPVPQKAEPKGDILFGEFDEEHESKLHERMKHRSDTFSEYLLYLIRSKKMSNAEVYKRAIVDKKIFSKIKNNPDYHPQKLTALCLCVGAMLNLDETRDLLARAGYALSPSDKTDIIFSFFIENEIYDMIELDIQLEEYGVPCVIS